MKNTYLFSSCIGQIIANYLTLKQALGRQCKTEFSILKQLDIFLNTAQCDLTADSFIAWHHTKQHLTTTGQREQMRITRNFCLYRQRTQPSCFIPDLLHFPKRAQSIQPHIFTEAEIICLLNAIQKLKLNVKMPLRQISYKLGLILLYTSGLRQGELIRLTVGDYNQIEHTLLIRESKFHKSRLVPLSQDAWTEIELMLKKRQHLQLPKFKESSLLWNSRGTTGFYSKTGFWKIFRSLFSIAKIRTISGNLPRTHDFRHTFAVHALLRWYREGADVQAKLPMLSTYMGHVSITSTQYYLRYMDAVIGLASERFENKYSVLVEQSNQRGIQ